MSSSDDYQERRRRAHAIWRARPSKKLEKGDQLVYHYALRCLCQVCGGLLDWEDVGANARLAAECCKLRYVMHPRTVNIDVEEISENTLLPVTRKSGYASPDADLSAHTIGEPHLQEKSGKALSDAQQKLRLSKQEETPSNYKNSI